MTQASKTGGNAGKTQPDDERLDKAIDDTFPASDPVSPGSNDKPKQPKGSEGEVEKELDESLEDTFPASDPLPLTDPDHPTK
ncbi:hypothetical protein IMZ29_00175 [Achromobacter sp. GG226]|uniref:hypothetical protein n=1 Tax=Verticiella alkaliphila TaxID=2779529 RepID=UPI001C0B1596|nr:hypothetical protein [Verticiella sp. GG226]MBU4609023.1 hypothetical protein [Verticiella sp. GG226]